MKYMKTKKLFRIQPKVTFDFIGKIEQKSQAKFLNDEAAMAAFIESVKEFFSDSGVSIKELNFKISYKPAILPPIGTADPKIIEEEKE